MLSKIKEKEMAVSLRRQGFSYSEILEKISVAKSTLSEWLKFVGLSKQQKQKLTEKKRLAALRGSQKRKADRILLTKNIHEEAEKEIEQISKRELWLIGIALYWAEGSKQNLRSISQGVIFSNSDDYMHRLFLHWLLKIIKVKKDKICFEVFVHENNKNRLLEIVKHWSEVTNFQESSFNRIYFKKHKLNTNRSNVKNLYFGQLRIKVKASTNFNRKISGWIKAIRDNNNWGVV